MRTPTHLTGSFSNGQLPLVLFDALRERLRHLAESTSDKTRRAAILFLKALTMINSNTCYTLHISEGFLIKSMYWKVTNTSHEHSQKFR
jgi:hypothetical protein